MPLPRPQPGTDRADWMKVCMGHETMLADFPEQDQRAAVCMQQWRDRNKAYEKAADFRCDPARDLPVVEGTYDSAPAVKRMLDAAGIGGDNPDPEQARRGFMIYDAAAPDLRGSYHLPFADIRDGRLTAIGNGIRRAASRLPQMNGVGPDLEKQTRMMIDHYMAKLHGQNSAQSAIEEKEGEVERAYSVVTFKAVNLEERVIEGWASTPTPDRAKDIVEPLGAQFKLPLPLIWQHLHHEPVGLVESADVTPKGIRFRARIPTIDEPGLLKDAVDKAWHSVKAGIIRGVSIGFRKFRDAMEPIKGGGILYKSWEWLELSLVTIPMNQDATIDTIKSIYAGSIAAIGNNRPVVERKAGGSVRKTYVSLKEPSLMARKSIPEQIAALEASRAAKAAAMEDIQTKAADEDRTKDEAEREAFDTLGDEIEALDKELGDLRRLEKAMMSTARAAVGHNSKAAGESREVGQRQHVTFMQRQLEPGIAYARFVRCCIAGGGIPISALGVAEKQYPDMDDLHMVLRAAVAAGSTSAGTFAGDLVQYQMMAAEFINYLRPMTVIGRIPGLRRVPFNIRIPRQTSGASAYWVGEGQPKPVTNMAFDTITLRWTKLANIAVLTDEVARFSDPSVDTLVRDDLAAAIVAQQDSDFLSPTNSGTTDVKPASITNGVTPVASSGTDAADVRADVVALIGKFITLNIPTSGLVWVGNETTATVLSTMMNTLGQPEFPGMSSEGGTFMGRPFVASQAMAASGSPLTSSLILMRPSDILLADDGQVTVDASREASLQMDNSPTNASASGSPSSPTPTTTVSMFQSNSVAIRAERYINWARARTGSVQYLSGVAYAV